MPTGNPAGSAFHIAPQDQKLILAVPQFTLCKGCGYEAMAAGFADEGSPTQEKDPQPQTLASVPIGRQNVTGLDTTRRKRGFGQIEGGQVAERDDAPAKKSRREKPPGKMQQKRFKEKQRQQIELSAKELLKNSADSTNAKRAVASSQLFRCAVIHRGKGYLGSKVRPIVGYPRTLEELDRQGYHLVKSGPNAVVVVDSENRVVLVRVKRPVGIQSTILDSINPILDQIAELMGVGGVPQENSRGTFTRVQLGFYHGNGSMAPHPFKVEDQRLSQLLKELLASPGGISLTGHVRASLMTWLPQVGTYLAEQHDQIKKEVPNPENHLHNKVLRKWMRKPQGDYSRTYTIIKVMKPR